MHLLVYSYMHLFTEGKLAVHFYRHGLTLLVYKNGLFCIHCYCYCSRESGLVMDQNFCPSDHQTLIGNIVPQVSFWFIVFSVSFNFGNRAIITKSLIWNSFGFKTKQHIL